MAGFFYVLILPEEPQLFKAQFPRNREQIDIERFTVNFAGMNISPVANCSFFCCKKESVSGILNPG
jgi:hypothetical protein